MNPLGEPNASGRFAAESRRIGILTTDTNLVVKSWDAALERMTGISGDAACGRRLDEIVPDLRDRHVASLLREPLVSGSAQVLAPALHKFLIPCAPHEPSSEFDRMQQRVVAGVLRDDRGIAGLVITVEDVTARLDRERALARQLHAIDPSARLAAVRTLASFPPTDGLGPLSAAIGDDDWQVRRAAVRALAARQDAELVDAIVGALRDGHRNFGLLSSALQLLTLTGIDFTQALIGLLGDADPDLRMQAALALGTQRHPEAVTALIGAIDDSHPNVQFHAIEALGKLAPAAAIERLTQVVESREFFLAFPAIEALVRIGDPLIAPRLAPLLADPILSGSAAEALAQIGDEDAIDPLVGALNDGTAPAGSIVDALAAIHGRYQSLFGGAAEIEDLVRRTVSADGVQRLLDALASASGKSLRHMIVVIGWLHDAGVPGALARLLGSSDARHEVVEAFVRFGAPVVELLIDALARDDNDTRRAAIEALGRIGDRRAVPALVALLNGEDRRLLVPVIGALARLGDGSAFDPLLARLGDADAAVRQAAVGALNSIGHPAMEQRIARLLDDPAPHVRESALKIAGYFGYRTCADRVLAACRDDHEAVRSAALEHLPYFDDRRAMAALTSAITEDTPRARAAAAQALGVVMDSESGALLLKATADFDPWVRYFAVTSLARLRFTGARRRFADLASADAAPHVRVAAIEALGALGEDSALPVLVPLAQEPGELGDAALRVMGRLQCDAAGEALRSAIRSPDAGRRVIAVNALAARAAADAIEPLQWTVGADADAGVREAALAGLARLAALPVPAGRKAVRALTACICEPALRDAAIATLAQLPPAAIPWIAETLIDDDPSTRRGVVDALGRIAHPSASACLQRALDDGDAVVRRQAVAALARLGTRGLTRRFASMAQHDRAEAVREAAAAALRRHGAGGDGGGA